MVTVVSEVIAILHQGELREMGRVDQLLKVGDVTQIQTTNLSDEAKEEIRQVVARHDGKVLEISNPTSTLEDLFLKIVSESDARPGRRVTKESKK